MSSTLIGLLALLLLGAASGSAQVPQQKPVTDDLNAAFLVMSQNGQELQNLRYQLAQKDVELRKVQGERDDARKELAGLKALMAKDPQD